MQLPGRRLALVAAGLVAGAVLAVLLLGRPAGAALRTASPGDGERVGPPPAAITLTFTAPVAQAHVDVSGAFAGDPAVDQRTVTVPVTIAAAGRYVVAYHVITADGAALSGTLPFTVGEPAAGGEPAAVGEPAPAEGPPALPSAHHHGDADPLTLAVLAVNVLVVLVLGVLFVRRRPRRGGLTEPRPRLRRCRHG